MEILKVQKYFFEPEDYVFKKANLSDKNKYVFSFIREFQENKHLCRAFGERPSVRLAGPPLCRSPDLKNWMCEEKSAKRSFASKNTKKVNLTFYFELLASLRSAIFSENQVYI